MHYPHCVVCGLTFPAYISRALVCSKACNMRRWRAIKMLEGGYGWVDGNFKRLPPEIA